MNFLTHHGYKLAVQYLLENQTEHGMAAAKPSNDLEKGTYSSLFPRDIGVSTLGMLASNNEELIKLAKKSLANLVPAQSKRGQFPQNYVPQIHEIHWWMPGTIDGTLWWSIGFLEYVKKTGDQDFYKKYQHNLDMAFMWLTYQDTNNDYLVEQGEAAGWDDEMPRLGTVLYSNALWYWFVKLRIEVEDRNDLNHLKNHIHEGVNTLLWVHKKDDRGVSYIPNNQYTKDMVYAGKMIEWSNAQAVYLPYYLGYSSHRTFEMRCETYGNILACITGLATEERAELITDFIFRSGINLPYPVKAMYPPIYPGENDWRLYMAKARQNYPWQYHNGGIWPYIGGFWVTWLASYDKSKAEQQLVKLAEANAIHNWEFNEYLHGQLGTPMGIARQSWNMAMYIYAYKAATS
ncbi:MAG TPA: glycoside hydrolase 100 family protein [Candidatus Woesebacteria bacterium]|nr:glycoside hydrolase 100 family protein [Candidatus Woesebacteria bacterium]